MYPGLTAVPTRFNCLGPAFVYLLSKCVVLRDALVALLAEQRRKFIAGGELCLKTVLQALLEARRVSLEVVDAVTRYNTKYSV